MIEIFCDLFNIVRRLKGIDKNYRVFYNTRRSRFEVHAHGRLQVVLPFEKLDERAIQRVYETRIENQHRLIEKMEAENKKIEDERKKAIIDKALAAL